MPEEVQNQTPEATGEEPKAPEKPEWLEESFGSVEAQAQAYAAARKQMREKEAEVNSVYQLLRDSGAQIDPATGKLWVQQAPPQVPDTGEQIEWDYENPGRSITKILDGQTKSQEERFAKMLDERLGPVMGRVADTGAEAVIQRFRSQLGVIPPEVEQIVRQTIGQLSPQQRLEPAAIEAVFNMAFGKYALEQATGSRAKHPQPASGRSADFQRIIGAVGVSEGRPSSGEGGGPEALSPKEDKIRQQMGLTVSEWNEEKRALERDREVKID